MTRGRQRNESERPRESRERSRSTIRNVGRSTHAREDSAASVNEIAQLKTSMTQMMETVQSVQQMILPISNKLEVLSHSQAKSGRVPATVVGSLATGPRITVCAPRRTRVRSICNSTIMPRGSVIQSPTTATTPTLTPTLSNMSNGKAQDLIRLRNEGSD